MPQINKIRIVNFNYNGGNRFIPDELYDLSSKESGEALNTLLNLDNGGGKTVLVQLMMQPIIPGAMAGGRSIKDHFSRIGDHSYILLEWNLDNGKDKLLTGISIATRSSVSTEGDQRGSSIKYYTFATQYEGYSAYDIASLELSRNENGKYVPESFDYVKEKAKASRNELVYYSSDSATKWSNYLSEFGIVRSEWKNVIETLNKDEGGLNQYFETAKTSDKLIEKFFIPTIENKLSSVASRGVDSSLETMLINYAKKINNKESDINQRKINEKLLEDLSVVSTMSDTLYNLDSELSSNVSEARGFKVAIDKCIEEYNSIIIERELKISGLKDSIKHIKYEKNSKEYYEALEQFEKINMEREEAEKLLKEIKDEVEDNKHKKEIIECAKIFEQIRKNSASINEIKQLIENKENESGEKERISNLKYSVFVKASKKKEEIEAEISGLENQLKSADKNVKEFEKISEEALKKLDEEKDIFRKAESELNAQKEITDIRIKKMKLEVVRRFDGFYAEEEVEAEKKQHEKTKEEKELALSKIDESIKNIENRLAQIPDEKAECKLEKERTNNKLKNENEKLEEYKNLFVQIEKICEVYSLEVKTAFSKVLLNVIGRDIEKTAANINSNGKYIELLTNKQKAAKNGYLHILPEIMDYVKSTGVNFTTGEEYLCGLVEKGRYTNEKVEEILIDYPELAYSLLFDNEKAIKEFLSAGNIEWLPAVVPLFTMEHIEKVFDGSAEKAMLFAVYDKTYFDSRKEYVDKVSTDIANIKEKLSRNQNHFNEVKGYQSIVERFNYSEDWKEKQEELINKFKVQINNCDDKIKKIQEEQDALNSEKEILEEEKKSINDEIIIIEKWLDSCSELRMMLEAENRAYNKFQDAARAQKGAEIVLKEVSSELEKRKEILDSLKKNKEQCDRSLINVNDIISKVDNAKEAELMEGDYDSLFIQYKTYLENLNKDLEELNSRLDKAQQSMKESEKELEEFACEEDEYNEVVFSQEKLSEAKKQQKMSEEKRDNQQTVFTKITREYGSAEQRMKSKTDALFDYDGIPLSKEEIGECFECRIKKAEEDINYLTIENAKISKKISSFASIIDKVTDELDSYKQDDTVKTVSISENPKEQWIKLKDRLQYNKKTFDEQKKQLIMKIKETVYSYKDIELKKIVGKLNFIGDMVEDSEIKGDRLFTVSESISTMIESIRKINNKIDTDLKEIDNEFNYLVNQCFIQGKRIYSDLQMIANSSKVRIFEGKPQTQMLRIDLPKENEISDVESRVSIKNELEQGAIEIKNLLSQGEDDDQIQKRAKVIVGSERLLHKYTKKDSLSVEVYKIDLNSANSSYKKWDATLTQCSGAEKFVIYFAVVLTLMNYARTSHGVITKNVRSVLILDNPFGKITSAHLLTPMFDIAKHFNVQLICLSDINKSDVTSCFECVIKLVIKKQNLSNFEIMTHEGNEKIEHGFYKIMNGQMSLF